MASLFVAWNGFSQDKVFDKLAERDDITQVTVTKSLLNMMPGMLSSVDMNGIDVKKLASKLEQIDIFSANSKDAKQLIRKIVAEQFKNNTDYEVLMKIKDPESNVTFYGQKEGNFIKSLVMVADEEEECTLIRLLGKFTTEDIRQITDKIH
jgi:hypothetical protein